jgi:seryl-tRNA synthetase
MLLPGSAEGLYLTSADFEAIVRGLGRALAALVGTGMDQTLRAPPVIAQSVIERAGYAASFPHLLGRVQTGGGAGSPSAESGLVLLPAACYGIYPRYEGLRLTGSAGASVYATCFRQEASAECGRLRSFRMLEFVRLGAADQCRAWCDQVLAAAHDWLAGLGLQLEKAVASDPFFGNGGRLMQKLQREERLKTELVTEVGDGHRQAVCSGNYHKDVFGRAFAISGPDGDAAHTACLAFGYERLMLALLHRHGGDPRQWPQSVLTTLRLEACDDGRG